MLVSHVTALSQGIKMNACPHAKRSSQPGGKPRPAISPRSLILSVAANCRLVEFSAIVVFRSTMEPLSHRTARAMLPSQENDPPTIWSLELIPPATLKQSPSSAPISLITLFLQRVAWKNSSFWVLAPPTISPASLSQLTMRRSLPAFPNPLGLRDPKGMGGEWTPRAASMHQRLDPDC